MHIRLRFPSLSPEDRLYALAVCVIVAVSLFFNPWVPYHVDTVYFMSSALHHTFNGFGWRWGTVLAYVVLGYLFGSYTQVVFVVFSILIFVFGAYLFFRRFLNHPFLPILITLSIPAAVMTLCIGKEDFFSMGLSFLAAGIVGTGVYLTFLAGLLYTYAVGAKETAVFFAPLFLPFLYEVVRTRDIRKILAFLAGAALLAAPSFGYIWDILRAHNPGMGVFYGFFSRVFPYGISYLIEGSGLVLLLAPLVFIAPKIKKEKRAWAVLYALYALFLYLYFSNVSVVSYRVALWIVPFLALPVAAVVEDVRFGKYVSYGIVVLCLVSVFTLIPNLAVKHVDIPAHYAMELKAHVDSNTIVLAMDSCPFITYFTGATCMRHPVYAFSDKNVWVEIHKLENLARAHTLLVYPDYFAYDRHGEFKEAFRKVFRLVPVYTDWYEDYHPVWIYDGESKMRNFYIMHGFPRSCILSYTPAGDANIYGLPVKLRHYYLECGKLSFDLGDIPIYANLVLFGIVRVPVFKAVPVAG